MSNTPPPTNPPKKSGMKGCLVGCGIAAAIALLIAAIAAFFLLKAGKFVFNKAGEYGVDFKELKNNPEKFAMQVSNMVERIEADTKKRAE